MKVYKYFNFNLENLLADKKIESLRDNYLWFSKPHFFNDPFDCNMEVINYYNDFLNSMERLVENSRDLIINKTKNFGICCFSKSNDNIHMWSHYADSHKGICIEYESSGFDDYFSFLLRCRCVLQEVDYRDSLLNLDSNIEWGSQPGLTEFKPIGQIISDPKLLDRLFEKLLLQKNQQIWSNEKELRLIIGGLARLNNQDKELPAGYKIPIKREFISSVIFGVNAPEKLQQEIKSIFGSTMKYQNAQLDFKKWKLRIE